MADCAQRLSILCFHSPFAQFKGGLVMWRGSVEDESQVQDADLQVSSLLRPQRGSGWRSASC